METPTPATAPEGPKRTFGQRFFDFFEKLPSYIAAFFSAIPAFLYPAFAWVAGCDLGTVKTMPSGELNKKASLGLAMIFTITVAALAASNAAGIFLSEEMRWPFAILWALLIFSIDRMIIVSLDMQKAEGNGGKGLRKVLTVVFRFIIIFFMSYITSTSVEMIVFKKEIASVITEKRYAENKKINAEADSAEAVVDTARIEATMQVRAARLEVERYSAKLDSEIDTLQKEIKSRRDLLQEEVAGRVGSGKQGMGPTAKAIMLNITADSTRLAVLEARRDSAIANSTAIGELNAAEEFAAKAVVRLDKRSALIKEERLAKLAKVSHVVGDGFMDRYLALGELRGKASFIMIVVFVILMLIESLPVILKLSSSDGLYEEALGKQLQTHRVQVFNKQELDLATQEGEHLGKLIAAKKIINEHQGAILDKEEEYMTDIATKKHDLEEARRTIIAAENETAMAVASERMKGLTARLDQTAAFINDANAKLVNTPEEPQPVRAAKKNVLRQLLDEVQKTVLS